MKKVLTFAAVMVTAVLLMCILMSWTVIVSAEEAVDTGPASSDQTETQTVAEETAQAETAQAETTQTETEQPGESLYEIGRAWADEHPNVFSAIITAIGLIVYGGVQLIGYFKVRRPVIKSSNNAVEMYASSLEEMNKAKESAGKAYVLAVQEIEKTRNLTEMTMGKVVGAVNKFEVKYAQRDDKIKNQMRAYEEATLLMAKVIGRLLEESSLPARTRDEIHAMVQEADQKINGMRNGEVEKENEKTIP